MSTPRDSSIPQYQELEFQTWKTMIYDQLTEFHFSPANLDSQNPTAIFLAKKPWVVTKSNNQSFSKSNGTVTYYGPISTTYIVNNVSKYTGTEIIITDVLLDLNARNITSVPNYASQFISVGVNSLVMAGLLEKLNEELGVPVDVEKFLETAGGEYVFLNMTVITSDQQQASIGAAPYDIDSFIRDDTAYDNLPADEQQEATNQMAAWTETVDSLVACKTIAGIYRRHKSVFEADIIVEMYLSNQIPADVKPQNIADFVHGVKFRIRKANIKGVAADAELPVFGLRVRKEY